ncbi:unnamed protein product [Mycena citricolor]|uniref:BRCT domain-containing protein n=1 Tax=Mycena citricolor TaxID=2018698 RepID=A0AAD2HTH6_9AGAR|nr:unnamed protein product [Mycena citricolor]
MNTIIPKNMYSASKAITGILNILCRQHQTLTQIGPALDPMDPPLFEGVSFHITESYPTARKSSLERALQRYGGTRAVSVYDASLIVTNTMSFEGRQDVDRNAVSIVTDLWVDRTIALKKPQKYGPLLGVRIGLTRFYRPEHYSADPAMIFSGVIASSADLRDNDVEIMTAGIVALGGQWRVGLMRDVTHVFAMNKDDDRSSVYSMALENHVKVLLPAWFDDSVTLGQRDLATVRYQWPDPPCLRKDDSENTPASQRKSMSPQKKAMFRTAVWEDATGPPAQIVQTASNVWTGNRILLSPSLELAAKKLQMVRDAVVRGGGVVVKLAANNGVGHTREELQLIRENRADILITRHRVGRPFFEAFRKGKTVGTLAWLLNVGLTGVYSSPMDQLLHFPCPPGKVPGFQTHSISITNYTGEIRDYLKKLITMMGGEFTPTFGSKNTALVAAYVKGGKTDKAAEWSIPIVNQLWLEDCFFQWKNLTPALSKYISHPQGVDLPSITGDRGMVEETLRSIIASEEAKEKKAEMATSQNSADENEVLGGLMAESDADVAMTGVSGDENDQDPPTTSAGPSTPRRSQSRAATPFSSKIKRIRALPPSSDSERDNIPKTPTVGLDRSSPRKQEKEQPRTPGRVRRKRSPSPSDAEQPKEALPPKKKLVRRVTGQPVASSSKLPSESERTPTPPPRLQPSPFSSPLTPQKDGPRFSVVVPTHASLLTRRTVQAASNESVSVPPRSLAHEEDEPEADVSFESRPKRMAATKANQVLHETIMPDMNKYQQEMRNRRGRRSLGPGFDIEDTELRPPKPKRRKTEDSAPLSDDDDDDVSSATVSKGKRRETRSIRLMTTLVELDDRVFSSTTGTGENGRESDRQGAGLHAPCRARHSPDREVSVCISRRSLLLRKEWAVDSAARGALLPENNYIIDDPAGHEKYAFDLSDALARARVLKGTLFKNKTFYITPSIKTSREMLKNVVEANGGSMVRPRRLHFLIARFSFTPFCRKTPAIHPCAHSKTAQTDI